MIATGGNRPLALLQIDYMIDGDEAASIVGVFIVVLTWGVAMIARGIGRRLAFGRSKRGGDAWPSSSAD